MGVGLPVLLKSLGTPTLPVIVFGAVISILAVIIICLITTLGQIALIIAISGTQKLSPFTYFRQAWPLVGRYLWLSLLTGLTFVFGYLLLIIPGIILMVWLSFASFILISEKTSAFDSLLLSREYIRKHWWAVFGRLLFIQLFFIAPALIASAVDQKLNTGLFSGLINLTNFLIIGPLITTYIFELFQNLKSVRGQFVFDPSSQEKTAFILMPVFGLILSIAVPLIIISLINPAKRAEEALNTNREAQLNLIENALKRHKTLKKTYPSQLETLVEEGEITFLPPNIEYSLKGDKYQLCLTYLNQKTCQSNEED